MRCSAAIHHRRFTLSLLHQHQHQNQHRRHHQSCVSGSWFHLRPKSSWWNGPSFQGPGRETQKQQAQPSRKAKTGYRRPSPQSCARYGDLVRMKRSEQSSAMKRASAASNLDLEGMTSARCAHTTTSHRQQPFVMMRLNREPITQRLKNHGISHKFSALNMVVNKKVQAAAYSYSE